MTARFPFEAPWPAVDVLEPFIAPERVARVDTVLRHRLGSVTAVFEDVFDPHNVAACMRTCEAYGLQDVHWVLNKHDVRMQSSVAKSSDQWIDLHRHNGTAAGVAALKADGYQLWVSDLEATETLAEIELPPKVAIVIGNAKAGISEEMRAAADRRYILPMWGMVQSFNLSVALAITLEGLVPRRRAQLLAQGRRGDLSMERLWALRRRWLEYGMLNAEIARRSLGDLGAS